MGGFSDQKRLRLSRQVDECDLLPSARKSSSSLLMMSDGSPCGIPRGLNSSHRSRNASALREGH